VKGGINGDSDAGGATAAGGNRRRRVYMAPPTIVSGITKYIGHDVTSVYIEVGDKHQRDGFYLASVGASYALAERRQPYLSQHQQHQFLPYIGGRYGVVGGWQKKKRRRDANAHYGVAWR